MDLVASTVAPLFLIIALGAALSWRGFLDAVWIGRMNALVYWVALPSLIVEKLAGAKLVGAEVAPVVGVFVGATALLLFIAAGTCLLFGHPRKDWGVFLQGTFRGNLAFVGLPVLVYLTRGWPEDRATQLIALAVLVFAPVMLFYNVLAVVLLEWSRRELDRAMIKTSLGEMARNPLIIAALLGLLLNALGWSLWEPLRLSLNSLSAMSAPLALLCIGGTLMSGSLRGRAQATVAASLLKVAVLPCVAWLLMGWVPITDEGRIIVLVFSACPTALASYVMSERLGGDAALASGIVFCSTLTSVISMTVVVLVLA